MNHKQPHKTIGRDTPWLTYAIFARIATKQAKVLRRKLKRQRYKLALRNAIEKLTSLTRFKPETRENRY